MCAHSSRSQNVRTERGLSRTNEELCKGTDDSFRKPDGTGHVFRFQRGQPYSEVNLANREAMLESAERERVLGRLELREQTAISGFI